jgi:AAA+ superfamily predicted ATPase
VRQDGRVAADDLIASLVSVLEARPDDVPLRLHVAGLLLERGRPADALPHVSHLLGVQPGHPEALALLQRVTAALAGSPTPSAATTPPPAATTPLAAPTTPPAATTPPATPPPTTPPASEFDWSAAEQDFGPVEHPYAQPAFVDDEAAPDDDPLSAYDIERPTLRLADVGGMDEVKRRLDMAFLTPMRNPQLREAFGKSLRGGLLMYGPPGCGKTFIARALAGELGAKFASVSLSDVLDMYIGTSERNIHSLFEAARRSAPCVLFLDELDALGLKRSQLRGSAQRGSVNQLLTELDGVGSMNEGVFVLAATNAPWDIDAALRRPGRLDRMLLVLPPDPPARDAILRHYLSRRPVAGIDLAKLVKQTDNFSGADLAHLVETASEQALEASVRTGQMQPITMRELGAALKEVRPSTGAWFATARNVAEFGNDHGEYDELLDYLKRRRMA